ncbi:hypothetical protein JRO89_XS12G0071100 [Xanthoceras sorbifolium]|uniref:Cytochrome c-type biogenesis protein CcmE n=1 Tax=Xanthoceras sorbifolium TaxID=99658 RepID=A0ABQ8HBJ9_9ROSI|nr:hypothetical protein JRO89_XS12G0071100 [Xanthoceras sorbifolium]
MAARLTLRLRSQFLSALQHNPRIITISSIKSQPSILSSLSDLRRRDQISPLYFLRLFSTACRHPVRSNRVDIGARARQLQNRRLWTYALTFSCIAGFIVIVLNNFQDQLVFYRRASGIVAGDGVRRDGFDDRYSGPVPGLAARFVQRRTFRGRRGFREADHREIKNATTEKSAILTEKARCGDVYFSATEVLAKHDEKYMPPEVAAAIEKNKKMIEEQQEVGGKES